MTDRLKQIAARCEGATFSSAIKPHIESAADVPFLLGEVERLREALRMVEQVIRLRDDTDGAHEIARAALESE